MEAALRKHKSEYRNIVSQKKKNHTEACISERDSDEISLLAVNGEHRRKL